MTRVTVSADTGPLRLSVESPRTGSALRVWRGTEAARILDQSVRGWRELGSFSAQGKRVTRQVFLAATALALAGEPARAGDGR